MSRLTVYGGGLPPGGAVGQFLAVGATGPAWQAGPVPVPAIGTAVSNTASGYQGTTSITVTVNQFYLSGLWLPVAMALTSVQVFVGTGVAGSVAELGIFAWDPTQASATLVQDLGSFATATNNAYVGYSGTTPDYGPGWIGVGVKPSAAIVLNFVISAVGLDRGQGVNPGTGFNVAGAAGAFAPTYSAAGGLAGATPYVRVTRGAA